MNGTQTTTSKATEGWTSTAARDAWTQLHPAAREQLKVLFEIYKVKAGGMTRDGWGTFARDLLSGIISFRLADGCFQHASQQRATPTQATFRAANIPPPARIEALKSFVDFPGFVSALHQAAVAWDSARGIDALRQPCSTQLACTLLAALLHEIALVGWTRRRELDAKMSERILKRANANSAARTPVFRLWGLRLPAAPAAASAADPPLDIVLASDAEEVDEDEEATLSQRLEDGMCHGEVPPSWHSKVVIPQRVRGRTLSGG